MMPAVDAAADCHAGRCDHLHPAPLPEPTPERRAEVRVREAIEELRAAIRCLPDGHPLRRQFEAEAYAPWHLRAQALLYRVDRDQRAWQRLSRTLERRG